MCKYTFNILDLKYTTSANSIIQFNTLLFHKARWAANIIELFNFDAETLVQK